MAKPQMKLRYQACQRQEASSVTVLIDQIPMSEWGGRDPENPRIDRRVSAISAGPTLDTWGTSA
jgi:hypothetical protein